MNETIVCPYCRAPFDESNPPKIFCTACGVPHHEDCYQDNGGCTVFGCARAPADDPKMQVSQSDLNAAAGTAVQVVSQVQAQEAAPVSHTPSIYSGPLGLSQPASVPERQPKSRTTYIVLGIFLGALGIHNFYAGYTGRAIGQLCLSVLTLFYLAIVSWIWAIVEICVVDKDNAGIQFG
jgi:TM2 domain-containing membrane protein YozV